MERARIKPFCSSSLSARRASEPLTFSFSEMMEGVMSFSLGTSESILSYVALSKRTRLESFSFTLPLLHFCEASRAQWSQLR